MSTTTAAYTTVTGFLITALVAPFVGVFAQSGRIVPKLPSQAEAPKPPEATPKFVPDPNAEKYKLVFALSSEGKMRYTSGEKDALNRALYSQRKNYVELLNKEGASGYRLLSSISGVALVKQENIQYEYAWFVTTSVSFFAKQGFETEYTTRVEQGFSLVDHLFLSRSCEISPPNSL